MPVTFDRRSYRNHVAREIERLADLIAHVTAQADASAQLLNDYDSFTPGELAEAQHVVTDLHAVAKRAYLIVTDIDPANDVTAKIEAIEKPYVFTYTEPRDE